jgi:hypothetical protein
MDQLPLTLQLALFGAMALITGFVLAVTSKGKLLPLSTKTAILLSFSKAAMCAGMIFMTYLIAKKVDDTESLRKADKPYVLSTSQLRQREDEARTLINQAVYVKDPRSGLCFAYIRDTSEHRPSSNAILVLVDCTIAALLENKK